MTLLQKSIFKEDNIYNNKVIVDYDKKTVDFTPVMDGKPSKYYFILLSNLIIFMIYVGIYSAIIFMYIKIIFFEFNIYDSYYLIKGLMINYLISICFIIPFSLLIFNMKNRYKYYPKIGYNIAKFCRLLFFQKPQKKKVINKDCIIDNKFFIPYFYNIMLKYELYGDFKDNLKSVKIINFYVDDGKDWFCQFEFYRPIQNGKMVVKYL